jgi:hypothetical protein
LPATSVVTLDPVVIQAQRTAAAYQQIGFDERRKTAHGFFLDATQIARMGASKLHDLAGRAPGFQYVRGGAVTGDEMLGPHIPDGSLRVEGDKSCLYQAQPSRDHHVGDDPTCTVCVSYYADGTMIVDGTGVSPSPMSFRDIEARYPPDKIAALEVYGASAAPPTVTHVGGVGGDCAAIVIWTKRYLGLDR